MQKQEAQAIPETVNSLLTKQQNKLIKLGPIDAPDEASVKSTAATQTQGDDKEQPVEIAKSSRRNQPLRETDDSDEEIRNLPISSTITKAESQSNANNKSRNNGRSQEKHAARIDSIDATPESAMAKRAPASGEKPVEDDSDSDDKGIGKPASLPRKDVGTTRSTRPVNTRKKKVSYYEDEDSVDELVEDDDDSPLPKKGAATGRSRRVANAAGRTRSRSNLSQSQLSFAPVKRNENSTTRKRGRTKLESDDEYQPPTTTGSSYDLDEDWGTAKTDTFDP